jgi:hypothetical protein
MPSVGQPLVPCSRLTDSLVRRLPLADGSPYRVIDREQPGLSVVVGRRTKSFTVQADLRQNRRRARTLKRVFGHAPEMSVRAARAAARQFLGAVARGEGLRSGQPAGALTLGETWHLYETEHLRRLGRSELTIAAYRHHVEHHLREWRNSPLADLAREPRRVADMHTAITQTSGPAMANAVMRTLRILYRFGRRQAPGELPEECPTVAITFHPQRRRNTALGLDELATWHEQRMAIKNPIRREFHLLILLSGSRPGALKIARWCDVDVRHRLLHLARPKGGPEKAFDIPLSRGMLASLLRARREGHLLQGARALDWIFPASSTSGHLVEHREDRQVLSHWGGDLRQTYRTVAQAIAIAELDVHLLMNHSLPSISAGYITRSKLVPKSLCDAQERLSKAMLAHSSSDFASARGAIAAAGLRA